MALYTCVSTLNIGREEEPFPCKRRPAIIQSPFSKTEKALEELFKIPFPTVNKELGLATLYLPVIKLPIPLAVKCSPKVKLDFAEATFYSPAEKLFLPLAVFLVPITKLESPVAIPPFANETDPDPFNPIPRLLKVK